MLDAIPLITILVAGADGHIDETEMEWAEKLTSIRSYESANHLPAYYETVGAQFSDRLVALQEGLPTETEARTAAVSAKLAELNPVMHKLSSFDAIKYYKSFRSFAKHVAEASGGILRFISIGPKEADVVELPMLDEFK